MPWIAPTAHGGWLLVIVAALIAGGRYLGLHLVRDAGLLLACVAAAALAAALLKVAIRIATFVRSRPRLVGPTRVQVGETARWILAAGRTGRYYPAWVLWRTPESRELQILVEGRSDLLFAPSQRGPCRLRAGSLLFTDPLGLWRAHVPLRAELEALALPRPVMVGDLPMGGAVSADRLRADRGDDLAGLRDYRRGDHLSSVHWRQSARLDRLVVVDAERPARVRRTVLLDTRAGSYDTAPAAPAASGTPGTPGAQPVRRSGRSGRAEAGAFETAVSLAAGVLGAWESTGADLRLVMGRRVLEADAGGHEGIMPLLEALALVGLTAEFERAGSEEPGSPDGDPPDVVITGAAALAGLGRELAAPRATGDLLVVGSAADARAGAALGAWGMRTVPVGAERFGDAAAVRGDAA
ncbi:DUF58 domain-containing protein [Actinomyces massiliensis]|uniref:DUF58 domain-containing protein n=1 Tax=Actinomyces massiliensis TaxID=461393 RepID=UPI0002EDF675|nr:DUF58 domain-containing protein [Actinomyces massiliensis]WLD72157.1 DUF58 domain-containing protein [Actinomyces massiliensis]